MESLQSELYFKTASTELELQSCYRLRFQVYCKEKQWLSESAFPDGLEIDEYDAKAVHVIAMDEDFRTVGTMRILREKDYKKLPYYDHPGMKGKILEAPNVAELSRFIVSATKNRSLVVKGLLRKVYQTSRIIDVDNWVFVLEPSLVRFLASVKFYIDPICQPSKYYGGFTLAGRCDIRKNEQRWRQADAEALIFNQSESIMISPNEVLV
jgi:N-acyl-L-homoserine lactone synthetase